jgi:hypothetical protein
LHAGVNAGFAAVALVTAFDTRRAPIGIVADGGSDAAVLVVGAGLVAAATYVLFTRWSGSRSTR